LKRYLSYDVYGVASFSKGTNDLNYIFTSFVELHGNYSTSINADWGKDAQNPVALSNFIVSTPAIGEKLAKLALKGYGIVSFGLNYERKNIMLKKRIILPLK
jgi:hypothetical protein